MLAGCSASSGGSATTAASSAAAKSSGAAPFPTLTAPALQPPQQHNVGRSDVVFDPCTWIDDATLTKLGYDPPSRTRSISDIHGEYTFLSCDYKSPDSVYSLTIMSGNRTMAEGRAKYASDGDQIQDTTIDGRQAMIVREKAGDFCSVVLQDKVGYIDFDRNIASYLITSGPVPERCSGMVDLVKSIIPRIGDN
ncbi:DUF3558 domain-containing protein [Nocardia sp. CA2R105]|uniref:DUF3558 family protein n=1 Tax=Nocardia coffeae TaxID=2873381 RepID=UPI001CA733BA|nr:DUF3558 family protein [Nocardia coffeae]MBY8855399.1 DUF3558 domain-containing protein [Nocardia coffeae]